MSSRATFHYRNCSQDRRLLGGIASTLIFALLIATVAVSVTLSRVKRDRATLALSETVARLRAYAKRTGKLPTFSAFLAENPTLEDPYGSVFGYFYDSRLEANHICSYETGGLTLRFCLDADCKRWRDVVDVAAVVYSAGPDEASGLPTGKIDPPATIIVLPDSDDLLSWITQSELRLDYACSPPPRIATTSLPPAIEDSSYFAPIRIDGGNPPLRIQTTTALDPRAPEGFNLGINPASFALEGSVDVFGGPQGSLPKCRLVFPLKVMVVDAYGLADVRSFALVVKPAPLRFKNKTLPRVKTGKSFRAALPVEGGNGAKTFKLVQGPSWVEIDSKTGVLSGVPTRPGVYPIVVAVTDKCDTRTEEFVLIVDEECPAACRNTESDRCKLRITNANFAQSFFFRTADGSCREVPPGKHRDVVLPCSEKIMIYGRNRCFAAPLLEVSPYEGWRGVVCAQNCRAY